MTKIVILTDPADNKERPFYTPSAQAELWNINWSVGEEELLRWFDCPEIKTLATWKSEIIRMATKKLRESREIYASHILNTEWAERLHQYTMDGTYLVVNCLDNGSDALLMDANGNVIKSVEMKSTKAKPKIAYQHADNVRGDPRGSVTFDYTSAWKFHLSQTDDHDGNLERLIESLATGDILLIMFTTCFESGITGIMDMVILSGYEAAQAIVRSTGNKTLRQINPSTAYGINRELFTVVHTERVDDANILNNVANQVRLVA